jgi:2-oxoglutarate dehydrogenase E1 component
MHRGVKRVYDQRRAMIDSGEGVDWGMAEALAFGTLISEGVARR